MKYLENILVLRILKTVDIFNDAKIDFHEIFNMSHISDTFLMVK